MKNNIRVSVAMATYNGEKYIKEQLDSIIINLKEEDEIVISDDGSTDNTVNIIQSYHDSRIKLFDGPKSGVISNFENAISKCSGEYIFLADQDDIWDPKKVDIILNNFLEDPDLILQVHDNVMVDSNLKPICNSFFEFRKVKNGFWANIIKNSFIGCCMAFRSKLISDILPIPKDMPMHDQWIGLIALRKGKVAFIKDSLLSYRRHGDNVSEFRKNSIFKMFWNRVLILKNVFFQSF